MQETWNQVAENVMFSAQNFSQGDLPDSMTRNLQKLTRDNYDYTEFLKKFAVRSEKMKLDMDEFDYGYYLYGLRNCKKIALIEPLEYKEEYEIKEFVIAIDTSGSCSGELVEQFLNKTYSILSQAESFSHRVVLHLIQCDAIIQDDIRINSLEELADYTDHMELHGFGGTDFRPVFDYVNQLCESGEFSQLSGLLYFTDGYGTFPEKAPDYKTAFVFVNRDDDVRVPPWAMKVYIDEETGYEH